MAHFGGQWELAEGAAQLDEEGPVLFRVSKRPRELHQETAELLGAKQRPEPVFEGNDFRVVKNAVVGETAVQLGAEQELRVVFHLLDPQARNLGPERLVEAGVDLDRVEVARQKLELVETTRAVLGVNGSVPMRVRPSARAAIEV